MKKLSRDILATSVLAALCLGASASADTSTMTGTGVSAHSGYGGTGIQCQYGVYSNNYFINPPNVDCLGWSWVYFEYIGGSDNEGKGMYFSPHHGSYSVSTGGDHPNGAWIPGECAQENKGFWHMGRNYEAENLSYETSGPGDSGYIAKKHNLIHRDTYTKAFVNSFWDGSDKSHLEATDTWSASGKRAQLSSYNGISPFYLNDYNSPIAVHNPYLGRDLVLDQTLTLSGVNMYRAAYYGKDADVREYYANETGQAMSDNVWGFCSYGTTSPTTQTYTGNAKITVSGTFSNGHSSEYAEDEEKDDVFELSEPTVTITGQGKTTAQDSDSKQQETNYTVTVTPNGGSDTYNVNDTWRGPNATTTNLVAGREYTICAVNNYASTYDSTKAKKFDNYKDAKACIKVKYDTPCDYFDGKNVGDYEDYGRMEVFKEDMTVSAVGDGGDGSRLDDSAEVYKYPENNVSIRYFGCMGVQAKNDADGADSAVVYAIDSNGVNDLYNNTKNYIDQTSLAGRSISGFELGLTETDGRFNENGPTAKNSKDDRAGQRYQFGMMRSWTSMQKTPLGSSYLKTYSWPKSDGSTKTVTTTINTPYNYVLAPSITNATESMLTLGSTYELKYNIVKYGRENAKLGASAATDIKENTIAKAWVFTLDEETSLSNFESSLSSSNFVSLGGKDYLFYDDDGSNPPMSQISNSDVTPQWSNENVSIGTDINKTQTSPAITIDNKSIGTKVCSMVAVWPGDSHNFVDTSRDKPFDITATDPQDNALTPGPGIRPFWRFQISCTTLVKYPNMSVEGGSAVTKGGATGSITSFDSRIFGSWMEYDLVANNVANMGSGASLAYANPQTVTNANVSYNDYGSARYDKNAPQTLGNYTLSYGGIDETESARYYQMAAKFGENIKSNYCEGGYNCPEDVGNLHFIKADADGKVQVNGNIVSSGDTINVILGENVLINQDVDRIDAIIIADNTVDTCNGHKRESDGNQDIYVNCNKPLVVNGAVVAKEIILDRTFGGGNINGESVEPDTLSQRAEIFNYDPRIVKAIYDITSSSKTSDVVYTKELSPRL